MQVPTECCVKNKVITEYLGITLLKNNHSFDKVYARFCIKFL